MKIGQAPLKHLDFPYFRTLNSTTLVFFSPSKNKWTTVYYHESYLDDMNKASGSFVWSDE